MRCVPRGSLPMHEMSLALEICRLTEEKLPAEELPRLLRVGVVVGDQANVETSNLEFCLEALLSAPPFGRARPVMSTVPGTDLSVNFFEVEDGG
jgi:Zn finger protein HypA/HybF involved in hydrogenase expression